MITADPIIARLYAQFDLAGPNVTSLLLSIRDCHQMRGEAMFADTIEAIMMLPIVPRWVAGAWEWGDVFKFQEKAINLECAMKRFAMLSDAYWAAFDWFIQAALSKYGLLVRKRQVLAESLTDDDRDFLAMVEAERTRLEKLFGVSVSGGAVGS